MPGNGKPIWYWWVRAVWVRFPDFSWEALPRQYFALRPAPWKLYGPHRLMDRLHPRGMKILLATDGSECSEIAAHSVATRPWPADTEIKIVCVRELLVLGNAATVSSPCSVFPESLLNEILEDARKRAKKAVSEAQHILTSKGLKVCDGPVTPVGDARALLLDEARAWGADLIVLGSHGRHGFDRLTLGSVSESVALYADYSVEVVRG